MGQSIPRKGDPLRSSARVSSQKQNVRGWSGPKADNIMLRWSRAWDVVGPGPGCDTINYPSPLLYAFKIYYLIIFIFLQFTVDIFAPNKISMFL